MADKGEAQVEAIWLKMGRGGEMTGVSETRLVEGVGIEGNADQGGYRQVTLLDADAWEAATAELGVELDPVTCGWLPDPDSRRDAALWPDGRSSTGIERGSYARVASRCLWDGY